MKKSYILKERHNKLSIKNFNPNDTSSCKGGKENGLKLISKYAKDIAELQDLLYANKDKRLLIILQGMDTAGKDGTIRHVFSLVNPQGVRVASFKKPTSIQLSRDFLWRIHLVVPETGEIVIFNRSHYEDVLTVRVHDLVKKDVWKKRYEHINAFEKMLRDEGTVILKFFLHIDKNEQTGRLKERLDTKEKQWKLSTADLEERKYWDDYQKAYEEVLIRTSTKHAPWYVVPANHKWYRNYCISKVIADTLKSMKLETPKPDYDPKKIKIS